MTLFDSLHMAVKRSRCKGTGYFIVAADSDWDVPTVRIDCKGCPDCRKPNQNDQFINDALSNSFEYSEKSPNQQFWVVLVNDQRVQMKSGKSIWKAGNHAMSAVRAHIDAVVAFPYNENYKDYQERKRAENDWIDKNVKVITYDVWFNSCVTKRK